LAINYNNATKFYEINTAKKGSKTAFKIRTAKLLASLNYHLNEPYVK